MNGNFKTLIAIAATPLLLLSCSDEVKLATESEGENIVSLTVQLPEELGTRAFGEASKIKSLKYAVYPQGEQQPLAMFDGKAAETVEMTGLSKNVQLQLASGKKYDVIFWAAADEVGARSKFNETTQVATLAPTVCSNEADDVQLALPANIAEGVVITGGTNSVLKIKNGYQIPNDNVTFKDVTLARDDSAGASDGCYLKINSDNVVLDNVKLGIINPNDGTYVGGGIYLNGGKTLTVRNTNFTIQAAYGVFAMDPGTTIILEDCNFGPKFQFCTNQPGNGKLIARNTTFRGWMSGWSDGYFENCTFDYGDLEYPYARCYGSSVFKGCEFGRYTTATDDHWLPTAPNRYDANGKRLLDYDYAVSCMTRHSIIEFINCRYSDGSAFNKNVFLKGTTDSSGDPDKVIINGTTYTDINEFTYW